MAWPFPESIFESQILRHHPSLDYKIEEAPEIFQGAQSYICKGKRLQTGKVCVLKTLNKPFITYKTFPIEMVALYKAQRVPGTIKLAGLYEHENEYTIAMEYWGDGDIIKWYNESEAITEAHIQTIWCQLVHIIKSLAEKKIYHRDVKFENVLINGSTGEIKLIDFGHAFIDDGKMVVNHTAFGTQACWPPEFRHRGVYLPEAWAVWTLGVFLYELIYGEIPSNDWKDYDDLKCDKNRVSAGCTELLKGCLTADPESRIKLADITQQRWFLNY